MAALHELMDDLDISEYDRLIDLLIFLPELEAEEILWELIADANPMVEV